MGSIATLAFSHLLMAAAGWLAAHYLQIRQAASTAVDAANQVAGLAKSFKDEVITPSAAK